MMYEGLEEISSQEEIMVTEKEEIRIIKRKEFGFCKCNACPKMINVSYHIFVGDADLIRLCTFCLKRFRRAKIKHA